MIDIPTHNRSVNTDAAQKNRAAPVNSDVERLLSANLTDRSQSSAVIRRLTLDR